MAIGNEGFLKIAKQSSMTQPASSGNFVGVPFISESFVLGRPDVVSDTIRGRYEEGPSVKGFKVPGGDVTFRLHPETLGVFLNAFCGQVSSTLVSSVTTHVFEPVQTAYHAELSLVPYTVEKYAGADESHFFHDGQCSRIMLEIAPGQYLRGAASFMFRTHSLATKTTPTFATGPELIWSQASVSLRGAIAATWESLTMTGDNGLQFFPALDGKDVFRRIIRNSFRTFRVSGTADFPNNDEFDQFMAGSEQNLDINVTGITLTGSQSQALRIQAPSFRYEAFPIAINGPNRITVGFTGRAVYNENSASAIRFTLINTRTAY